MIFGTDGIRARVGEPPMDRATIERLSTVLRDWLPPGGTIVIGSDTRASGKDIKAWVTAHLGDFRVLDLGVAPTPVVAYETMAREASLGIMVTASHNPAHDNGLKFFDGMGLKIKYELAAQWSERIASSAFSGSGSPAEPEPIEPVHYRRFIGEHFKPGDFAGLRPVFDLANGAGAFFLKRLCRDLEIEAVFTGDTPNGNNINDGVGATCPGSLSRFVAERQCTVGFAFDGDGDRILVADPEPIHGDRVLYALYHILKSEGVAIEALVGTIMCGMGLEHTLSREGVRLLRTQVGDQNVLACLVRENLPLGGETSGHIIQTDLFPAGDGFLAALRIARALKLDPALLDRARATVPLYPFFEKSYPVRHKPELDSVSGLDRQIRGLEDALGERGRLILRYSGTEPKIRVFVESPDLEEHREPIDALVRFITKALG